MIRKKNSQDRGIGPWCEINTDANWLRLDKEDFGWTKEKISQVVNETFYWLRKWYLHYKNNLYWEKQKMIETTHRYKDDWVILRFEKTTDPRKNNRTEYRTWSEWKSWVANAKRYWHEDDANQALVRLRFLSKRNVW